mmetsp:Transcript_53201/g.116765  ORF Transcript_53201/g.116765 Transcript_53201/m.116765 type:complete len:205 (-) Transcript_53201:7-621(-)
MSARAGVHNSGAPVLVRLLQVGLMLQQHPDAIGEPTGGCTRDGADPGIVAGVDVARVSQNVLQAILLAALAGVHHRRCPRPVPLGEVRLGPRQQLQAGELTLPRRMHSSGGLLSVSALHIGLRLQQHLNHLRVSEPGREHQGGHVGVLPLGHVIILRALRINVDSFGLQRGGQSGHITLLGGFVDGGHGCGESRSRELVGCATA